jgi:S-adenosylhomocysteine hydrolase
VYQIDGMPLLGYYSRAVSEGHFTTTNILYVNHIISDSLMVARALKNSGANIWIVSVPYGNEEGKHRKKIIDGFKELGNTVVPRIDDPLNFDKIMRESVKNSVIRILEDSVRRNKKFMIVEDGGYVFPLLHDDPDLSQALEYCLGTVEHTSRGMMNYQYMETDQIPLTPRIIKKPAITIATSLLKEKQEPPFIAQAVVDETSFLLRKQHDFLKYKTIMVLGYGRIGRALVDILYSLDSNVIVVDPKVDMLERCQKKYPDIKCSPSITKDLVQEANIIIGATGLPSFGSRHLEFFIKNQNYLPDKKGEIILVSLSSKQIEFIDVMNFFDRKMNNLTDVLTNREMFVQKKKIVDFGIEYYIYFSNGKRKKITILADGYPVSFFPEYTDAAPNRAMDPIMTELYLASCFLQANYSQLENRLYEISDLLRLDSVKGPWEDLIDEMRLVQKWIELNGIIKSKYLNKIGFL